MIRNIDLFLRRRKLFSFIVLFLIAMFTIGGCNDNNNGGNDSDLDTSQCSKMTNPCSSVTSAQVDDDTIIECVLSDMSCVFDLNDALTHLQGLGFNLNDTSIIWIGAWGGDGGGADENGGDGSLGGYAQTVTSIKDIMDQSNDQTVLYYFLGDPGATAPGHCGGGGGAATIVTFEDLTLNPTAAPALDPMFMIGGGGGGASGGTIKGCTTADGTTGGEGGVLFPPIDMGVLYFEAGSGCNGSFQGCGTSSCGGSCAGNQGGGVFIAEGGAVGMGATGGQRMCCVDNQTGSTNGAGGLGGLGGQGGQGHNCSRPAPAGFRNAALEFGAGQGGTGGGGTNNCTNGGGGGGGGFGGGGGGGHGGNSQKSQAGGGGGSAAFNATQTLNIAPTTRPRNPCGTSGCLSITFLENK